MFLMRDRPGYTASWNQPNSCTKSTVNAMDTPNIKSSLFIIVIIIITTFITQRSITSFSYHIVLHDKHFNKFISAVEQ